MSLDPSMILNVLTAGLLGWVAVQLVQNTKSMAVLETIVERHSTQIEKLEEKEVEKCGND
ncbi:hypothetical protein ACQU0X_28005 [Pseudovibrio ascidiaceicola]|uniref:hypothetical protein n=1 Tax=Pseudovibrio ascidiaceicola TaxID=285279 RepID=UPI003D36D2C6